MFLDSLAGVGLVYLAVWLSTRRVVRLASTSPADRLMVCGIAVSDIERVFVMCVAGAIALAGGAYVLHRANYYPDFTVFWAAAQDPSRAYDFNAITAAQSWLHRPGLRPFVYPPTFLLFLPFRGASYAATYLAWVVTTTAAFIGTLQLRGLRWLAAGILVLSPMFILVDLRGQSAVLVAALMAGGLTQLNRPALAGFLLAAAMSIKPQAAVLAPVALAAAANWRALGWMVAAGGSLFVGSVLIFGYQLWGEWARDLPLFIRLTDAMGMQSVTPNHLLGQVPAAWELDALRLAGIVVGVGCVVAVFRLSARHELRLAVLVAGSLLCAPYGAAYDLALLAPAAVAMAAPEGYGRWPLAVCAILFLLSSWASAWEVVGIALLVTVVAWLDCRATNAVPSARFLLGMRGRAEAAHPCATPTSLRRILQNRAP